MKVSKGISTANTVCAVKRTWALGVHILVSETVIKAEISCEVALPGSTDSLAKFISGAAES